MRHGCFLLCRHSLFPPLPPHVQSKQARQTPVSKRVRTRGGDRERDEGDMETVRHTELLPSDVPDGPIWFKSVLKSIISKTWSCSECPYQLDLMTKTLQVRADKFPWLCALKFILHSFHWVSSIFPSLFNRADKWTVAVIQSISCLSGHSVDSFIATDEARFLWRCAAALHWLLP